MRINKLIYPELSYKINGVLFVVHNELGRFCNEKQYCDTIEGYFKIFKLDYEREKVLPSSFDQELPGRNKVDFLIENKIILEIKTKRFLNRDDYYQIKRYLVGLNKKLGILVNFQQKYLTPKIIINSKVSE
jgi:GxxExxY protein